MAKTKTPFFSLGSRGTIAGSLTSQKRGAATLLRMKPIPTNPRTLPQMYQRWLYQDYAYLWTQQSLATRAEYRTAGSRYHLTGYQYWMRVMLSTLPDIALWWKLDANTGALAYDSSRQGHNGTVIGASPATGLIAGAYLFDGINDDIQYPNFPPLPQTLTIELDCYLFAWTAASDTSFSLHNLWNTPGGGGIAFFDNHTGLLTATIRNHPNQQDATLETNIPTLTWRRYAMTWDKPTLLTYRDGQLVDSKIFNFDIGFTPPLALALSNFFWIRTNAIIDNLTIYNRPLDPTEILRHSQRRYPLQ